MRTFIAIFSSLILFSGPLIATEEGKQRPETVPEIQDDANTNPLIYYHFMNALLLERNGRFGQALEEYDRGLKVEPDATLIYRQRANLYLRMGNPEQALADTQAYVERHPDDVEALLLLSSIHLMKGQRVASKLILEKVLEKAPDHPEALMTLSMLLTSDKPSEAIHSLEKLTQTDPASIEAFYQLGLLYQKIGKIQKSKEMFKRVIEIDSRSLPSQFILGQMSEQEGDIESAIRYYEGALERMPENFSLRMQLILLYAESMDISNIERLLERYKEDPSAAIEVNLWLGIVYEAKKNWEKSLVYYLKARKQSLSPEINIRLANVYSHLGKLKKAAEVLNDLVKIDPKNPQYRYFVGLAYQDLKEYRKAIKEFRKAIELKEDFSLAYFQMGVAMDSLKKWDEAEAMFRETIRIDSTNASAYNYIGYTYADKNIRLDEARKLIERALEMEQGNPAFIDSLGWLNFREGNLEAAFRHLKEAAGIISDPVIFEHLGDCAEAMGRLSDASIYYSKSLSLRKKNKKVQKKLERLNKYMVPSSPARELLKKFQFDLKQASNISGLVILQSNFGFFSRNFSRGFFYMRQNENALTLSTSPASTEMRVDLMDRFLLPSVVLRYRDQPMIAFSVFPPELENSLPQETGAILNTMASFLNGQLLQEFDQLTTTIVEKRKAFVLTHGDRSIYLEKKRGVVSEIVIGDQSVKIEKYKKIGTIWLPEKMKFRYQVQENLKIERRQIIIQFSHISLEEIESKVFEIGKESNE